LPVRRRARKRATQKKRFRGAAWPRPTMGSLALAIRPIHLLVEPGLGVGPVPVRRAQGDAQRRRGLLGRKPGEVAELDDFRGDRLLVVQSLQGFVEGHKVVAGLFRFDLQIFQVNASPPAAVADAVLPPSLVDEDAAHGLGGGGEKVAATVPALGLLDVYKT